MKWNLKRTFKNSASRSIDVFFLLTLGISPICRATEQKHLPPLHLEVGEQRRVDLPQGARYSVTESILRTNRPGSGTYLLVRALKPGRASILFDLPSRETWIRDVVIEKKIASLIPGDITEALSSLQSTETLILGDRVVLRPDPHTATSPQEAERITQIQDKYPQIVSVQWNDPPEKEKAWSEKLKAVMKRYPELEWVNGSPPAVWGQVQGQQRAEEIKMALRKVHPRAGLQIYGFDTHSHILHLKVYLLEMKQTDLITLGIRPPASVSGLITVTPFSVIQKEPMETTLNALGSQGSLKILSKPELVVRVPGKAELFAGGELPIRQSSRFINNVAWKTIGLTLRINVDKIFYPRVRLSVETEMSSLDASLANDELPGVRSNHMKTEIDAQLGKPTLLSGLIQNDQQKSKSGLPWISKIPIIGGLFGVHQQSEQASELVAILIPGKLPDFVSYKNIFPDLPDGYLPASPLRITQEQRQKLESDEDYPWNVL